MRVKRLIWLLAVTAPAACSSFTNAEPPPDAGGVDAGTEAAATADAADGSRPPPDGGSMDGRTTGCLSTRGPTMVRIYEPTAAVHFCIDSTEVSVAQYLAFVSAVTGKELETLAAPLTRTCRDRFMLPFDVDSVLQRANVGVSSARAATNIGWCQAQAYCAWAGKRLCGVLGSGLGHGGTTTPSSQLEWVYACSKGATRAYSYGAAAVPGLCNAKVDGGVSPIEVVHARPGCEGGYAGLFDMLGNVSEWESGYEGDAGDPSYVAARGSWFNTDYMMDCVGQGGSPDRVPRDKGDDRVGIRCCASP